MQYTLAAYNKDAPYNTTIHEVKLSPPEGSKLASRKKASYDVNLLLYIWRRREEGGEERERERGRGGKRERGREGEGGRKERGKKERGRGGEGGRGREREEREGEGERREGAAR